MLEVLGFTADPDRTLIGVKSFRVPGTDVVLAVRAEVAPLLIGLAGEFNRLVEPLHNGECWGFAFRPIRGSSNLSRHSAGIAIDLNAAHHPLAQIGTFAAGKATVVRALARKYGLRWGGDYLRRRDEMHFEVNEDRAQALARVRLLQADAAGARRFNPFPPPAAGTLPLHVGAHGRGVQFVQWALPVTPTGTFDEHTRAHLLNFQSRHALEADGIVGPLTLAVLATVTR